MKKKYSDCFITSLVVFPFDILISINQTDKEFLESADYLLHKEDFEMIKSHKSICEMENTTRRGHCAMTPTNHTMLRVKGDIADPVVAGTLAHELLHAVTMVLNKAGLTFSDDSDEAYAYSIGYLVEEIYTRFKNNGK